MQRQRSDGGKERLPQDFMPGQHAGWHATYPGQVIDSTQGPVGHHHAQRHQDRAPDKIQPHQISHIEHTGNDQYRHDNHQPSHGGGTHLGLVDRRLFNANLLADALLPQKTD